MNSLPYLRVQSDWRPPPPFLTTSPATFGYLRYTETQSNRIFVTVECLYGWKQAIAGGINRVVKP